MADLLSELLTKFISLLPLSEIENETVSCFNIDDAVLGECLCMIVNYQTNEIDVWVMKEYGSRDIWCKLFTLVKSCFNFHLESLRPLCYSSDRSKVLLVTNHASYLYCMYILGSCFGMISTVNNLLMFKEFLLSMK
ncbi:putative F-box associated domain, type 1 [Medicago truncatula]|uniref:Putative F-box associated domain, type 1 n=1 Tax=Medicago truncatula TaxID=3880 RepID=A4PU39_MEDTR|nr:hypothetical protein MtrDRAFT_AC144563g37v2 [Medicago truncatula]RHN49074.1 putative F-box associated domain, type 1 [Medicago truncatula]